MDVGTRLSPFLERLIGERTHLHVTFWDGSTWGRDDASGRLVVRSPNALKRITQAPGELGFGRAYVSGDLDVEGDIYNALALRDVRDDLSLKWREKLAMLRAAISIGAFSLRPIAPPPEEARLRGRLHSRARDAAAIAHHYDVSNDFYRMVLGPTLTYSCAYFATAESSLEDAQRDKHELICRKLRLKEGERVLDVGCGWGTFAIHAATKHGARVVGVTLSHPQAELAAKRVVDAGVADRVEIRVQDERDVSDGPYDAIASIGMFEHVGAARLRQYFDHLYGLLRPRGRLLNHGISRPAGGKPALGPKSFIDSYVFPDGELHEVGAVVSTMQHAGFEVRDVESLREHYALTLRHWVANLERDPDAALTHVSEGRYRVWRLYMAASALNFEAGRTQVHQVLAVKSTGGVSGVPLRRSDIVL